MSSLITNLEEWQYLKLAMERNNIYIKFNLTQIYVYVYELLIFYMLIVIWKPVFELFYFRN